MSELCIFARFHAHEGAEAAVAAALQATVTATREEPGCLAIAAFRSLQDPRLHWIHSRFRDQAAFERHAELPRVHAFLAEVQALIDHPLDITRTQAIA